MNDAAGYAEGFRRVSKVLPFCVFAVLARSRNIGGWRGGQRDCPNNRPRENPIAKDERAGRSEESPLGMGSWPQKPELV